MTLQRCLQDIASVESTEIRRQKHDNVFRKKALILRYLNLRGHKHAKN